MKKKNIVLALVAIVMVAIMGLSLVACVNTNSGGGGGDSGENTNTDPNAPAYIGMSIDNIAERNKATTTSSASRMATAAAMLYANTSGLLNKDIGYVGDHALKLNVRDNISWFGDPTLTPHVYNFLEDGDGRPNNGSNLYFGREATYFKEYGSAEYLDVWEKSFNYFKSRGYNVVPRDTGEFESTRAFGSMTMPTSSKNFDPYNRYMFGMGATVKDLSYYDELQNPYLSYIANIRYDRNSLEFQNKMLQHLVANGLEKEVDILLDGIGATGTYVDGPDFTLTINLDNPKSYEILSLTINGVKYQTYQFAETSTSEKIDINLSTQQFGLHEYTVDAIKYVDGTEIRDVRMLAERTIDINVVDPTAAHDIRGRLKCYDVLGDIGAAETVINPCGRIGKLNQFILPMEYAGLGSEFDYDEPYTMIQIDNKLTKADIKERNAVLYAVVSDVYKNVIKTVKIDSFGDYFDTGEIDNITINFDTPLEESMVYYISYVIGIDTYDIAPEDASIGESYEYKRRFTTLGTERIFTENVSGKSAYDKMLFRTGDDDFHYDAPVLFDSDAIRYDSNSGLLTCNVVWNDIIPEKYRNVESVKAYLGQTVSIESGQWAGFDYDFYQKRSMYLIDTTVTDNNGIYTINTKTDKDFEVEFACVVVEYDNGKKATMFFGLDGRNQIPATITIDAGVDGVDPVIVNATEAHRFNNIESIIDIERFKSENALGDKYIFDKLYTDEARTIPVTFPYDLKNGDATIYIGWKPIYQLSYETNGGDAIEPEYSLNPHNLNHFDIRRRPSKREADFVGWYFDAALTQAIPTGDSITLTEDTTLYAKWSNAVVTFVDTNLRNHAKRVSFGAKTDITSLGRTLVDYGREEKFEGIYYDAEFTQKVEGLITVNDDMTFYMHYIPAPIVSFVTTGGTKIESIKSNKPIVSINQPVHNKDKTLMFGGWYFDAALTQAVELPLDVYEDTTLYVKWVSKPVITLNANGGVLDIDSMMLDNVTVGKNSIPTPTKEGYIFAGWHYDIELNDPINASDQIYEDKTFYAKWVLVSDLCTMEPTSGITVDSDGYIRGTTNGATILVLDSSIIAENAHEYLSQEDIDAVQILILKSSVAEIGYRAFNGFRNIKTVIFESTTAYIGSDESYANDIFAGIWDSENFEIFVPNESLEMYQEIFSTTNASDKIKAILQPTAE